jgi:TonB-dependent SusC/RagA subfamily outer membrane receptor
LEIDISCARNHPGTEGAMIRFRATQIVQALALAGLLAGCQHSSAGKATEIGTPGMVATEETLDRQNVTRVEELLEGRFAGVRVFRHPGGIRVEIRGATSITGNNQPLYILDGMPLDVGSNGALLGINPNDIARIEVLKDIGSTAFYGVRGANGVVLITSKRE